MRLEVPNFGYIGREGDIYVPTRTIRVAIPEGTGQVRLQAVRGSPESLDGVVLAPPVDPSAGRGTKGAREAALQAVAASRSRGVRSREPVDFEPPGVPVTLGDTGYLRDQRFVEVIFTPVVSPKGGGRALFYGDIELDLVVEGVTPEAVSATPAPADPTFESFYRDAVVNYDEGRYLRHRGPVPQATAPTSSFLTSSLSPYATTNATIQSGAPGYKITISKEGIYRLSQPYLLDPNRAPGLSGADPRQFKLMNRGVEVPIYVQGEADGSFGSSDYVEFYGQTLDGPEVLLNYDLGLLPSIYQYDDYSDKNVYWLSVDSAGTRLRIPSVSAPPDAGFPITQDFGETLHFELDTLYQPSGGDDPFQMAPRLNSNNGSVFADASSCNYVNPGIPSQANGSYLGPGFTDPNNVHYCPLCRMTLPGINTSAATNATVRARLRGTTSEPGVTPDHLSVLEANGVAARSTAACWSGLTFNVQTLSLTPAQLTNPLDVRIELPGLAATTASEQLLLDWTEVSYRRLFQAVNDGLKFTVPDNDQRLQVTSLSTGTASSVEVFEITDQIAPLEFFGGGMIASPVRVTGGTLVSGGGGTFNLTFDNDDDPGSTSSRTYVVAGPGSGGLLLPDSVVQGSATAAALLDATNEADVIVIGDPSVIDTSAGSAYSQYWAHRTAVDGFVVKTVMVQDAYEVFSYGIPHPEAIRNLLGYAYDNWKGPSLDPNRPPVAYVTIVGDTTADPKNNLNRSDWVNVVPTYIMYQLSSVLGFYSSDNYLAAFRGTDQIPDVHLGRLPLRTLADSTAVFTKLLNYETASPTGTWRGHITLITDEGKAPGESSEFQRISDEVSANYWQPQPPYSATKLYYDTAAYGFGNDPNKMFDDIIAAHDAGTVIMQYTGHGSFSIWGVDGYFFSTDVNFLQANSKYSFQINENCLSGGFHTIAGDALSEAFVKVANKGSVAFFAPAGLSFSFIGESINNQIYTDMFGPKRTRRFGPLITDVRIMLGNLGSIIDLQSYAMIGDPTLSVIIPNPRPPRNLRTTAGNAQVAVNWDPSLDPGVKTLVYRATSPSGPYSLLTPSALTGTTFTDATAVNATVYYYEASSVDTSGFEGQRGNFNSDCVTANPPASGPDCVWAKPENPNAPATPSNAIVYNDGSGAHLRLTWSPNGESDLAGYTVRYGTTQGGPYPMTLQAAATDTSVTLNGLTTGTIYYMRLTARNTSLLESAATAELSGRPMVFDGENSPRMIDGLMIVRTPADPNSLTLSWTAPTLDIYGGPTTISSFSIYRDTTPGFIPSLANRIATITNPAITSYIDVGAHAAPTNYYYLVTATDPRGFDSGASHEVPNGVSDLQVDITGSLLHFTWSPVTVDVRGGDTLIQKYMLYASDTPISRTRVDSLTPLVDNIQSTSLDVTAIAAHKYYTLIVVDMRGIKSPF